MMWSFGTVCGHRRGWVGVEFGTVCGHMRG